MKTKLLVSMSLVLTLAFAKVSYSQELIDSVATAVGFNSVVLNLDGVIDDVWGGLDYINIRSKTDGEDPFDENDFSGKFKIGWKDNFIYVLVDITDDVFVADPTFAHKQDACEFYVDLQIDELGYEDVFAFYKTINADGSASGGRTQDGWEAPAEGVEVAVSTKAGKDGWIAEWTIDASVFGVTLETGMEIGINVAINDRDDIDLDARKTQLAWKPNSGSNWATSVGNVGTITLGDKPTSAKDFKASTINVYPNPATGYFTINQDASAVEIYSITGSKVKSFNQVKANSNLSVEDLNGMYFVNITNSNGKISSQKLIVQ